MTKKKDIVIVENRDGLKEIGDVEEVDALHTGLWTYECFERGRTVDYIKGMASQIGADFVLIENDDGRNFEVYFYRRKQKQAAE